MNREDWLLVVVAAGERPLTPVQLQKTLFLIKQANLSELPDTFYDFKPYHFGPFDAQVYRDADMLFEEGLVVRHRSDSGTWIDTTITGKGRSKAQDLEAELRPVIVSYIHSLVRWAQGLSFRELVGSIYHKYPDYRANSVFQD